MKTNLYSILGRNLEAERNGVWVTLEHDGVRISGVEFFVKSFASDAGDKYRDLYAKIENSQKEDLTKTIAVALIESGIVSNWKGITNESGAVLDFVDSAIAVLGDPTYDAVVMFIIQKAQNFATFRENAAEKNLKN
jgi:hypothetical protein